MFKASHISHVERNLWTGNPVVASSFKSIASCPRQWSHTWRYIRIIWVAFKKHGLLGSILKSLGGTVLGLEVLLWTKCSPDSSAKRSREHPCAVFWLRDRPQQHHGLHYTAEFLARAPRVCMLSCMGTTFSGLSSLKQT